MVSCGMENTRPPPLSGLAPAPQKIGKYEIISEIGKGATSAVFRAYDPFQSRQVAIKVVFPEALGDREYGRRYRKLFVTEASSPASSPTRTSPPSTTRWRARRRAIS